MTPASSFETPASADIEKHTLIFAGRLKDRMRKRVDKIADIKTDALPRDDTFGEARPRQ